MADENSPLARLAECERRLATAADAPTELKTAVSRAIARYREPMRVAVVAQIKRGKSTLVNALLREDIAPTAQLEATFTVGEFHHAPTPQVTVHFNDTGEPLRVSAGSFRGYTINDPGQAALLRRVRRVEYGIPNPLLRRFRLLDTPGLGSIYHADSANTLMTLGVSDFLGAEDEARLTKVLGQLGRTASDLHADTLTAIDTTDAVVYLFDRGLNQRDASVVTRFLGPLRPSLNALKVIGVLSRCDQSYWPSTAGGDPLEHDPLAEGRKIVERRLAEPEVSRMFFRIHPVAALASAGAQALTDLDLGWLGELVTVEPRRLATALGDANWFARAPTIGGVALPAEARAALVARLGAWGTLKVALYLRDGTPLDELRQRMDVDSGVADVRRTLLEHFGNRSAVLKLDQALLDIKGSVDRLRMSAAPGRRPLPPVTRDVAALVERVRLSSPELPELAVLEDHYRGRLQLDGPDLAEVLRVTGERGRSVAARLGLPDAAPLAELIARADERAGAWANRGEVLGLEGPAATAAAQIAVSYSLLAARVRQASRLLDYDDELADGG
ncbi:MAG TPA: dynamin family protein [Trebonia sp.]|jgi:hypothetical protein|nr:dynamin family protein [Trebonia sp.]